MVLKHSAAIAILGASVAALPRDVRGEPLQDRLNGAYERILSKNGIELSGEINAEYLNSGLEGSARVDTLYGYETTQFTSFDLNMHYRPYDFVSARADFRFYQDWQTFFSTRSRILTARWLSVDGNVANTLGFNVGDFRQKYTPLTVWTPGLDLLHEPVIFSRGRAELMQEQYLEGNDRNLQGVNLNLARRFDMPLSEVRVDGLASRLRRAEHLDADGAQGRGITPSDMDRFLFAGNAEVLGMDNILLGGSVVRLADDVETFERFVLSESARREIELAVEQDPATYGKYLPTDSRSLNGNDSVIARDITVTGAHAGLDVAGFLGNRNLTLDFLADWARSSESNKYAWAFARDSGKLVSSEKAAPGEDGTAFHVEMGAGWQAADSVWGFRLTGRYLSNEAAFLNPAAQSPSFMPQRILNTENDFASGALYSTFDALNNGVYKFTPSRRTAAYQQAPFTKNSYDNGVLSPEDLAAFAGDPVLQLALPFGLATPNRKGATARLLAHWQGALHLVADLALLEQAEGDAVGGTVAAPAKLTQMGGGAKLELADLLGWENPLDLSASFVRGESKRDPVAGELADPAIKSDLLMAGAYWRFVSKWALLGGYQQAVSALPNGLAVARNTSAGPQFAADITQRHWRVGLEYALTRSAYVQVGGGVNSLEATLTHAGTAGGGAADPALNRKSDFSQTLGQALVSVKF